MLKKLALFILGCAVLNMGNSQLTVSEEDEGRIFLNTITTAVPFLLIAPDSRSGGIGDAGVALSADATAIHWNPAKMAFAEDDFEVQLSYSPWLRALVNDMNLAYLSGYRKLNKTQAFGAGLRFFSLGTITFTSMDGSVIRDFKPSEFTIDAAFSQKLSDKFSGGIGARFINSNLTGGTQLEGGADTKPGRSVGVDVSIFYTNDDVELGKKDAVWNVGLTISNIGAKMSYTSTQERDFIPANLRLGTALTTKLDTYNELTLTLDANKLLVPTPPIYDPEDETLIAAGMDPDVGVAQAMVQSFYDAPGNYDPATGTVESGTVLREELREINLGGGLEYWYDKQFAFRLGYFYEHYTKGNRQFLTLGAGLKYTVFGIDLSYIIATTQQNPLANTLRFTLRFQFDEKKLSNNTDAPE